MLNTLLSLIILVVALGLVWYLVKMLPLPDPFGKIIDIVFILIAIVLVLGLLFGGIALPVVRFQ